MTLIPDIGCPVVLCFKGGTQLPAIVLNVAAHNSTLIDCLSLTQRVDGKMLALASVPFNDETAEIWWRFPKTLFPNVN